MPQELNYENEQALPGHVAANDRLGVTLPKPDKPNIWRGAYSAEAMKTYAAAAVTEAHGKWDALVASQDAEIERLRAFIDRWTYDGSLQTFEHRQKFRSEAQQVLRPNV